MPPSPYDLCPCGSGKKYKWCCTAFFDQVELALEQQQQDQHDAALATMQALTAAHPTVPQVWGYFAHILFAEGKTDEAEEAVGKAFALQPDFPMGHLLRGLFRQAEGEVIGALLLFRKAFESYPADAVDQIGHVGEMIARHELMLNRPVAARAALSKAVAANGADGELKEQYEALFGPQSRLPAAARKEYKFRPMTKPIPAAAGTGKLSDARKAFEEVTKAAPADPAAWFNLGLTLAWLGEQPKAVEALMRSVELEVDDYRAEEAAALVEVLKCGSGMEADADHLEYRAVFPIRDPEQVLALLQAWDQEGRIMAPQADPQGTFLTAMIIKPLPSLLETGTQMATVQANVTIAGGLVRLWGPLEDRLQATAQEVRDRVNLAVGEPTFGTGPIQLGEVGLEALAFPIRTGAVPDAENKLKDYAVGFFEGPWLTRPLKSLGGANAVDAVGSTLMRKRLLGVIRFLDDALAGAAPRKQENGQVVPIQVYDFDRLRRKLGLEMAKVDAPATDPGTAAVPAASSAKRDVTTMSAADLAGLDRGVMSSGELEDAMKAAIKLDARELAVAFAKAGVARPADAARPDRYPLYICLMTAAQADNDANGSVKLAHDGAAYDADFNGGKRAVDYGLRAAAVLLKTGKIEEATAEFDTLLTARPDDGNLYVKAAEAMLGAKRSDKAATFAERGLAKAQELGSRDLEGACRELLDAAKRYK